MKFATDVALTTRLHAIEQTHAETGTLPSADDPVTQGFRAHFGLWDARLLEAIVLRSCLPGLFKLRAYLLRGRPAEAQLIIDAIQSECADNRDRAELLVEKARLSVVNGRWRDVIAETIEASRMSPSALSQLSLYQIQALALFEIGDFKAAKRNLEKVESLSHFLPRCSASFYAKMLMLRIVAREQCPSVARRRLRDLITRMQANKALDRNHLQTMLRTEIDLRRLEMKPHFREALASLILAEASGEKLYSALAVVDCAFSENTEAKRFFESRLRADAIEFDRVALMLKQLTDAPTDEVTTSAQAIRKFGSLNLPCLEEQIVVETTMVLLLNEMLLVDTSRNHIIDMKMQAKLVDALCVLAAGAKTKSLFFKALWGSQKYAPELHDGLIYSLLYRLKKKCGALTRVENGSISLLTPVLRIGERASL